MKKHYKDILILFMFVFVVLLLFAMNTSSILMSGGLSTIYQKYAPIDYNSTRKIPQQYNYKQVSNMIEPITSSYSNQYFNSNQAFKFPISIAGRTCNSDRCAK
jgi:hypothetical protein